MVKNGRLAVESDRVLTPNAKEGKVHTSNEEECGVLAASGHREGENQ